MPASEALLDEETIKRFRSRYREQFGANATQDPLYQALSEGRRMAGMEHWLPLLEERLGDACSIISATTTSSSATAAPIRRSRRGARRSRIITRTAFARCQSEPGSYRPLEPRALYLRKAEWDAAGRGAADPPRFALPRARIRTDHRLRRRARARFRARARPAGQRLRGRRRACEGAAQGGRKVVLASYTTGARERLARPARGQWPQGPSSPTAGRKR